MEMSSRAGRKVQELRIRLWQEHLGLLPEPFNSELVQSLADPLDPKVYFDLMRQRASRNTQIYRELFHCVPDDSVGNMGLNILYSSINRILRKLTRKLGMVSM